MIKDTADMFKPKERGRFGDNEFADERSPTQAARSNLVDLKLFFRRETLRAIEVTRGEHAPPENLWLPKSQIEYSGKPGSLITVALPKWLAEKKGLL